MIDQCRTVSEAKALLQRELDFCGRLEEKNGGCMYRGGILCSQCGTQKVISKLLVCVGGCQDVGDVKMSLQKEFDSCKEIEESGGVCPNHDGLSCSQCGVQQLLRKILTGINEH